MLTLRNQTPVLRDIIFQFKSGLKLAMGGLLLSALVASPAQALDKVVDLSEAPVVERSEVEVDVVQVPDPMTLDEAVYQLRRDGSRVLRARAVGIGDILEYHIRILTPDQRVRDVIVDPCCTSVWTQED